MFEKSAVYLENERVAREINEEARRDPTSPYAGKFVGLANGRVVVVADNLNEVARQLRLAEPDPARTFGIEAGLDYDAVQEIWAV